MKCRRFSKRRESIAIMMRAVSISARKSLNHDRSLDQARRHASSNMRIAANPELRNGFIL